MKIRYQNKIKRDIPLFTSVVYLKIKVPTITPIPNIKINGGTITRKALLQQPIVILFGTNYNLFRPIDSRLNKSQTFASDKLMPEICF